jgi:hypothetical protein
VVVLATEERDIRLKNLTFILVQDLSADEVTLFLQLELLNSNPGKIFYKTGANPSGFDSNCQSFLDRLFLF